MQEARFIPVRELESKVLQSDLGAAKLINYYFKKREEIVGGEKGFCPCSALPYILQRRPALGLHLLLQGGEKTPGESV